MVVQTSHHYCDCGGLMINGKCNYCGVTEEEDRDLVEFISGSPVKIKYVTLGRSQLGECSFKDSEILIDKDLSKELREDTKLHEVIHYISDANALGLQETDVAVLALNLSQYLRVNKL